MALFWRKIGDKVSGVFLALQIIEVQGAGDRQLPDQDGYLSSQVDFLFTNPTKIII